MTEHVVMDPRVESQIRRIREGLVSLLENFTEKKSSFEIDECLDSTVNPDLTEELRRNSDKQLEELKLSSGAKYSQLANYRELYREVKNELAALKETRQIHSNDQGNKEQPEKQDLGTIDNLNRIIKNKDETIEDLLREHSALRKEVDKSAAFAMYKVKLLEKQNQELVGKLNKAKEAKSSRANVIRSMLGANHISLLRELKSTLEVKSSSLILPRVSEILLSHQFVLKLGSFISELSPDNVFSGEPPSTAQIWAWVSNLVKCYMNLKLSTQGSATTEEIARKVKAQLREGTFAHN